jgi:hypothetical protein
MAMVLQQQRADQQMRQRTQDQQYDMQRMGAMGAMREMREPSIGEDDAMLEQEIRSGLYDPDTVRALRQDQRAMRQIMRDTNIDGTQRAQALGKEEEDIGEPAIPHANVQVDWQGSADDAADGSSSTANEATHD